MIAENASRTPDKRGFTNRYCPSSEGIFAVHTPIKPPAHPRIEAKTLATATVDRLLHHAHICQTSGESVRLTQAIAGKGVNALT